MSTIQLSADVRKVFQNFGKQGGSTTKARLGSAHYSRIGKLGMATRWGTKRQHIPVSVEGLQTRSRVDDRHDGGARTGRHG